MIEVLREGEPTVDGRFINKGAIELPEGPVPLFDFDAEEQVRIETGADSWRGPVGELFNFTRGDDDRIYCESTVDDDRVVTVTIAIDEHQMVAGESVGVARARVVGGVIGNEMRYPWD